MGVVVGGGAGEECDALDGVGRARGAHGFTKEEVADFVGVEPNVDVEGDAAGAAGSLAEGRFSGSLAGVGGIVIVGGYLVGD